MGVFTVPADTENVAELNPCGTVTDLGTTAAVFELESETIAPPEPAGAPSVTVPTPEWPPIIVLGLTEKLLSGTVLTTVDGFIVSANVSFTPA